MTTHQVRVKQKSVTRRFGWWFLKPGDVVQPVEKGMGLKKGEKVKKLGGPILIISTRREPLNAIMHADVWREGFGSASPCWFVAMMRRHYRCVVDKECNRIEFEYLDNDNTPTRKDGI